jgi:L-fuconolactonase
MLHRLATGMRALAARPGTPLQALGPCDRRPRRAGTISDLAPFVAHILEVFGPERVMWGSDWPVCRLRAEYSAWWEAAEVLTADLAPSDRAAVFGGTARAFLQIGVSERAPIDAHPGYERSQTTRRLSVR